MRKRELAEARSASPRSLEVPTPRSGGGSRSEPSRRRRLARREPSGLEFWGVVIGSEPERPRDGLAAGVDRRGYAKRVTAVKSLGLHRRVRDLDGDVRLVPGLVDAQQAPHVTQRVDV